MSALLHRALLVSLCVTAITLPCAADEPPPATLDATVKLTGGGVAAGVGYKWGHGTLFYHGQSFHFCIRGLSIGDIGAASADADGAVYNLTSLEDFGGKYFALSEGVAIARGESAAILKNKQGVMMELKLVETGVRFNIAATGLKIVMANEPGCKPTQH